MASNKRKGPRKKYGQKIDYRNIPQKYLVEKSTEGDIETRIYQAEMLHRDFAQTLNVVIITKTNLKTGAFANVNLFSSDLELSYEKIIDFYSLRFQIEFNFRDAKQYWGLEDFHECQRSPADQCTQPVAVHGQPFSGACCVIFARPIRKAASWT